MYKIPLNNDPVVSTTMDASVTEFVSNYPNNLQPLQIIALADDLIAISCSAFKDGINGQLQIWNVNSMSLGASYEFDDKSRKERISMLPNLIKNYNIPLDDDFKVLVGAPKQIRPNDLKNIAQKLSVW